MKTLLQSKLQLPAMTIERAHRVGQQQTHAPRTIVARFAHFSDREAAMRNARKLKGTRIFINEDLCPASQEMVKSQLPQLKQARADGKIAFFRHTRLIIKDRTTTVIRQPAASHNHNNEDEAEEGRLGPGASRPGHQVAVSIVSGAARDGGASVASDAFPHLEWKNDTSGRATAKGGGLDAAAATTRGAVAAAADSPRPSPRPTEDGASKKTGRGRKK